MKKGSFTLKLRITFFLQRKSELLRQLFLLPNSEFHFCCLLPGEGIAGRMRPRLRQCV